MIISHSIGKKVAVDSEPISVNVNVVVVVKKVYLMVVTINNVGEIDFTKIGAKLLVIMVFIN